MQHPPAAVVTPHKPQQPVDISTIEAAKENIVPLHSGRSASQLAALSSSSRSGLGVKLDAEHARFAAQIAAVEAYEQTGAWEDGKDGLSSEEVALLAEDPLDISHQYVRFIVANYPAGASAANKLVPVLEATTRKFLSDSRYFNDPRYFRLWAHYAKNMENPEDCYRFLFAKGIGEKLAALYEEYAKVLEAKHKRKQADQVYNLGINRSATPLDRLKRSYLDFQTRMLVAPPVPSPPRATPSSLSDSRSILSSSTSRAPLASSGSTSGTGVGSKGNGSMFAVFRDDAGAADAGKEAGWEDFGTVKSRQRENNEEKKEWAGEVMPQKGALSKPGGGFKLEVYRDESAGSAPPSSHGDALGDVFSRSTRPLSEAEQLRANPFKNYAAQDVDLLARDPLEGLEVLPRASSSSSSSSGKVRSSSSTKERSSASASQSQSQSRSKSSSSRSSSSSTSKPTSSSAAAATTAGNSSAEKPKERVAVNIRLIYPSPGVEYSFEELKMMSRKRKYVEEEVEGWGGWEWAKEWDEEVERTKKGSYKIREDGRPVLFGKDGEPLYNFLPRPAPTPPSPTQTSAAHPSHSHLSPSPPRPIPSQQEDIITLSPAPRTAQPSSPLPAADEPAQPADEEPEYLDPHRPPSPTMNTRAANALLDHLFAKTLDFTKVNSHGRSSLSDSDDEASTDESDSDGEDDDEEEPSFGGVPGTASQYSTQQATQQSQVSSVMTQDENDVFVPFSQTRSQMGDDSGFHGQAGSQGPGSLVAQQQQQSQLGVVGEAEEKEGAENPVSRPPPAQPMQLFRDSAAPAVPSTPAGAFRPVTKIGSARAPLGMKSGTPLAARQPPKQPLFSVFSDAQPQQQGVFGEVGNEIIPSSQPNEADSLSALAPVAGEEQSYFEQADFQAPLADIPSSSSSSSSDDDLHSSRDGYDLGRRQPGQSRYAPFVEQMTPIVERTLEFTGAMSSLSASTRSRRESYYPGGGGAGGVSAVKEEDEEEEPSTGEEEEEDDDEEQGEGGEGADQAFVAAAAVAANFPPTSAQQQLDGGEDSSFQSNGSSTDSDDSDDDEPHQQQQHILPGSLSSPSPSIPALAHFEQAGAVQSSPGNSRSFEVSLDSRTLPESLTITGNQSGMTTNVLVGDATASSRPSDASSSSPSTVETINPFDRTVLASLLLDHANPSVLDHPDVHDLRSLPANRLAGLQKVAKSRARSSKGSKDRTGVIDDAWDLELNGEVFSVREKLGEGAFGAVFRVALTGGDDDDFDVDAEDELSLAVKVETPPNLWEFHVLDQLHQRLPNRTRSSVVSAQRLYAFQDESFLFLDYCDQGSLLDAVNRAHDSGVSPSGVSGDAQSGLDELLAMFFVVELLRTLEGFHNAGFVHGDLKIDNCLLRLEDVPGGARAWASTYDSTGANGWSSKGVKLIDFGRTIDLLAFPAGQQFKSDFEADGSDCAEMREDCAWTYEPDYFGVASIAYNVLHGKEMKTAKNDVDGRWGLADHAWKRYYQQEMWTKLFDMLLNPKSVREDGALPITEELAGVRREMEEYLRANGEKSGKSLRGLIKKLEIYSMSR